MIKHMSVQRGYFAAFLFTALLLCAALFLEIYQGIVPCPLCLLQRYVMGLLAIIFLIGLPLSYKKSGQVITAFLALLVSTLGVVIAGRQVWLQHLPPNLSSNCDVGLRYMLEVLPFHEVIQRVFQGSSTCAEVSWQFLQVSLAGWSLMCFIAFLLFALWQLKRSVTQ